MIMNAQTKLSRADLEDPDMMSMIALISPCPAAPHLIRNEPNDESRSFWLVIPDPVYKMIDYGINLIRYP
jgi:hypothetical protein